MRIAVITDIHGNAVALETALADIATRGADATICLGDIASGAGWPAETVERLQAAGIPCIRGNHDRWISEHDPAKMGMQDRIAYEGLTASQRDWLMELPATLEPAPGVLAVHGTPSSDVQNLIEEVVAERLRPAPMAVLRERLGEQGMAARVVLCGHSHRTGMVQVPGGPLVVNPGSLGLPGFRISREPAHRQEAGTPHARYAMLDVAGAEPAVEMIAIAYDWDRAARRAEEHGAGAAWPHVIRTGLLPESA
ncbi:metallophosphoesterase family protein [Neoroseomonas oryzicola]|uniref:Metallophosphoesterase family protein n=1 Tax=Neoroseomonas oryzicola TaxID=535904 RepID=A0A9X9WJ28_9PROT|nr:metallophosphoesterase family protein [Neoroseomonas oryzicola]MBR0660338.1 metallophosphoesterase family protein [Neoroseomonas oryzicola]NKE18374.1 metallophosphoesterase family protein [Neoroseomonas oryzicola]